MTDKTKVTRLSTLLLALLMSGTMVGHKAALLEAARGAEIVDAETIELVEQADDVAEDSALDPSSDASFLQLRTVSALLSDEDTIRQIQHRLISHRIPTVGEIDGVFGEKTARALDEFCKRENFVSPLDARCLELLLKPGSETVKEEVSRVGQSDRRKRTSVDNLTISDKGIELIGAFEGYRSRAYRDPVGVWTIGYGTTRGVYPGQTVTKAEAIALKRNDIKRFEAAMRRLIRVPVNQDEWDALVSFTYNLGEGALGQSTLLRRLNAGDYAGASEVFDWYNKAGGRVLSGLVRRRNAEQYMFRGWDYSQYL